jgi:hypothetical protein
MREQCPIDAQREAGLRQLFGRLRVTYTGTSYTTELDGVTESGRYEVLGQDRISIVTRQMPTKPSPLELSEFTIIYFDGPDCYWLNIMNGGSQEYFKRVKASDAASGAAVLPDGEENP